jgi:hypothetical protein
MGTTIDAGARWYGTDLEFRRTSPNEVTLMSETLPSPHGITALGLVELNGHTEVAVILRGAAGEPD